MIMTNDQPWLRDWLCWKINYVNTDDLVCIGSLSNGQIKGVAGYDDYAGTSIKMHIAGEGYWLTKAMLYAMFDYPFNVCGVNLIYCLPVAGSKAHKFAKHIGFNVRAVLENSHPEGDLLVMAMRRDECRFIKPQQIPLFQEAA